MRGLTSQTVKSTHDPDGKDENWRIEVTHENDEQVADNPVQARSYPLRERKPPKYSAEFNTDLKKNSGLQGHVEVLKFFFFSGFFTQLHKLRSLRQSFPHLHFFSAVHI